MYTPIHVHSDHSLLDGISTVEEIAKIASTNHFKSCTLTDHGTTTGLILFQDACEKYNIKPILGVELYVNDYRNHIDAKIRAKDQHIVLLVKNKQGWKNLCYLVSEAYKNGFYYRAKTTNELIWEHHEGLIITTACIQGILNNCSMKKARSLVRKYKKVFGDDFYIELQFNELTEQKKFNRRLLQLSEEFDVKTIIGLDSHYVYSHDAEIQDIFLMMRFNKHESDFRSEKLGFTTRNLYMKSEKEIYNENKKFHFDLDKDLIKESLDNTNEIADKCNFKLEFEKFLFPKFFETREKENEFFEDLVYKKFDKLFKDNEIYEQRLEKELDIICDKQFVPYFLVLWDIMNYCKKNNIMTGAGRGCHSNKTLVLTKDGYKNINQIQIGDLVLNRLGQWDKVENVQEYDCDENLISFILASPILSSCEEMTLDHKNFILKDPFKNLRTDYDGYIKGFNKLNLDSFFDINKAEWVESKSINKNDYFVRYVGDTRDVKDVLFVDLSKYAVKYDDKFVYEEVRNLNTDLSIRNISKNTKISRGCLKNLKNGLKFKKESYNKLNNYLESIGYTFEDFKNYSYVVEIKYDRFLKVDKELLYIMGYYIGDGWYSSDNKKMNIGFAFNNDNKLSSFFKISEYFKNFRTYTNRAKNKNLIQFYINSRIMNKLFKDLFAFGSENKSIPDLFYNLPLQKMQYILDGLIDSDGHKEKTRNSITTTSLKLALQLKSILEFKRYYCSINKRVHKNKDWSDSYTIRFSKNFNSGNCYINGDYLFIKVKDIKVINNNNKVYDLTVENDPSYHTANFITHNSACGSLVSYVLGITKVDPIKHNLFFERFLDPSKVDMPDVDIDFESERKHEVEEYIVRRYGIDNTCKIISFNTIQVKRAMETLTRLLNLPKELVDCVYKLRKQLPDLGATYDDLYDLIQVNDDLYDVFNTSKGQDLLYYLERLIGRVSNYGKHAAGILITPEPVYNYMPVQKVKDVFVSAFTEGTREKNISRFGLLKIDILGLTNLSIVRDTIKLIEKRHNKKLGDLVLSDSQLNDKKLFSYLRKGETAGIFQFESEMAIKLIKDSKPSNFGDIVALNALNRPATLKSGQTEQYVINKTSKKIDSGISKYCEELSDILQPTYGILTFQEQIIQIFNKVAGFDLTLANKYAKLFIKGLVTHEQKEEIQDKFVVGCSEIGMTENQIAHLWKVIQEFSQYSFNKSHATSYSIISMQNLYLKYYYYVEYMSVLLTYAKNSKDSPTKQHTKFEEYCNAIKKDGFKILPIDILRSRHYCLPEGDKSIRVGFCKAKDIGESASIELSNKRNKIKTIENIFDDTLDRRKVNKKTVTVLAKIGALDCLYPNRKGLLDFIEYYYSHASNKRSKIVDNIHHSRFTDAEDFDYLEKQEMEREFYNFYLRSHPFDDYVEALKQYNSEVAPSKKIVTPSTRVKNTGYITGVVTEVSNKIKIKNGLSSMKFITLSDQTSNIKLTLFSEHLTRYGHFFKKGNVVALKFTYNSQYNSISIKEPLDGNTPVKLLNDIV